MPFPQKLADQIASIVDQLNTCGLVVDFRYCIADLDPEQAAQPDFDDSKWISFSGKPPFRRDQGVTWVRTRYTVPDICMDIPLAGSQIRICPGVGNSQPYFSPITIYSDGEMLLSETAWMDCKCPEGIVSERAVPGQTHTIAVRFDFGEKSFWDPDLPMVMISDAVERRALHLASIVEELSYAEGFDGAQAILPGCYALLEQALAAGGTAPLMDAAAKCRHLCEPLREKIKQHKVYVVTHAHIDMNWFWPMEETEQIVDRDFTTMTTLMEENADFCFSQSQCATYDMEERNNPAVFRKMQEFAKKGQWDITASTWVEGDLNMASGESIARHMLYSKRYLAEKFGMEPRIMWCPDTFGHPANTPQILKKSGLDYYYHTRCGIGVDSTPCNGFDYVRDAHHVPLYWWKGQDGSRVLSVNLVYGREFSTRGVLRLSAAMKDRFGYDKCMFVFGVGDHGGGPTRRDIAWMREIAEFPTVPTLQFSTTHAFYDQVVADNPAGIPERCGEMNFVFDGCYTTHCDIKYYNRKCESDLEAVESLCALASLTGFAYPAAAFEEMWRATLFNQFHDILDGSGVKDTYQFSGEEGEKVLVRLREIAQSALTHLAAKAGIRDGIGTPVIAYNPTFAERDDCILLDLQGEYTAVDAEGAAYACQRCEDGLRLYAAALPPLGYRVFYLSEAKTGAAFAPVCEDGAYYRVATNCYDAEIHKASGRVTTLYDKKADRYVVRRESIGWRLKNGCLNTLQIHHEEPTDMSSWTIGNVRRVDCLIDGAASSIVEDGPVCKRLRFEHAFGSSTLRQDIVFYTDSPRIDFETDVDWQEYGDFDRDAPMLKVAFSPDVKNASVTYEIPFGVIERPAGDYECPALRWADIGDASYGFSLLNDSKYGHKCRGNALELTLIRSGWLPDQKSDIGRHRFTYSILPHAGSWQEAGSLQQAAFLNNPVRAAAAKPGAGGGIASMVSLADPTVPVGGVKRSEDGNDLIVRVYNTGDETVRTFAHTGFPIKTVHECDLLEKVTASYVRHETDCFEVVLGAREIKTYRIRCQ